jgi:hypothetical protein
MASLRETWSSFEEADLKTTNACSDPRASSFHFDASQFLQFGRKNEKSKPPVPPRFEPVDQTARSMRFQTPQLDSLKPPPTWSHPSKESKTGPDPTPLSRIYDILDAGSQSSRWLLQRGYLEPFKSPDCRLEINFGQGVGASKVAAVVTAPDGSRRTIVACAGGITFQRLTGAAGQELVKFLSSGQVVEFTPEREVVY